MRISDVSSDVCSSDLKGVDQVDVRTYDAPLTPGRIQFPEATYVAGLGDNPEYPQDKLRLDYESMVNPDTVFDYDLARAALETLKVQDGRKSDGEGTRCALRLRLGGRRDLKTKT